jgi:hypothetical protein
MAYNSISEFIGAFNGGFRPNRFRVQGTLGSVGSPTMTFHVRSANLPASSLSTIMIPYRGRNFKMPGNRTYAPWQIVVLDDNTNSGNSLWEPFHQWSEKINSHTANISNSSTTLDFSNEMKDWNVFQLDINGNTKKTITLKNCWPAEVGPISLNMDDNESLSTFPVTLEYSWYEINSVSSNTNTNNRNNTNTAGT